MPRIRSSGPTGVVRPFQPNIVATNSEATDQIADALDHVAVSLSAIDHNLEVIAKNSQKQAVFLEQIAAALNKR